MTDLLDQALIGAGLDLLTDAGLTVYDGAVPNPTPDVRDEPYVLVYTTIDRPGDDPSKALDGRSGVWLARWICHCVGANQIAARAMAQQVRTALLDQRVSVPGLATGLIEMEQANPPLRDESTGPVVIDAVVVFRLFATS